MRDERVPDDRLERLDVRRPQRRRRIDDDRDVGELGERAARRADDAEDRRADLSRELDAR